MDILPRYSHILVLKEKNCRANFEILEKSLFHSYVCNSKLFKSALKFGIFDTNNWEEQGENMKN